MSTVLSAMTALKAQRMLEISVLDIMGIKREQYLDLAKRLDKVVVIRPVANSVVDAGVLVGHLHGLRMAAQAAKQLVAAQMLGDLITYVIEESGYLFLLAE